MTTSIDGTDIVFGDPRQPKALPLSHPKTRWGEFGTTTKVLPKGYTSRAGCRPLPCDILFDRDVSVKLRDGVSIFIDVYRPTNQTVPSPAIIAWSPYGKQGGRGNQVLDDFPFRMGVPLHMVSELQKWEGPDPAEWVNHGYAVVNADPRGVGKSEGNIYQFGSQEGRDGADVVDWIGQQLWCNGKVALSGNSYLSISQWFIAAEQPKHLAAIAPWEGICDLYRDGITLGGVLATAAMNFNLQLLQVNAGENSWENTIAMAIEHSHFGAYHDDKRARIENIQVPAYVVASWSNPIHCPGTFRGYLKLTTNKWLRVHDSWEWPDYYARENVSDLRRFFDYYMKGIDNGWNTTPRFRAKILDTANPLPLTGVALNFSQFPPIETRPMKLFLDCQTRTMTLARGTPSQLQYKSNSSGVIFEHKFLHNTTLCGPLEMLLAISLDGANDADIFIVCEKVLNNGSVGCQLTVPYEKRYQSRLIRLAYRLGLAPQAGALFYRGPRGQIRVSRREFEPQGHVPGFPVSRMETSQPLKDGRIVQVQPILKPIGMQFTTGERLRICISGVDTSVFPPIDQATLTVEGVKNINCHGSINIHSGLKGEIDSYLLLPVIPNI